MKLILLPHTKITVGDNSLGHLSKKMTKKGKIYHGFTKWNFYI